MTCKKAQGFLEQHSIKPKTLTDANKDKQGAREALALAKNASKIVVARGKNIVAFDMKKDHPDDQTLLAHLLGPTGNLRAPTVRVGTTLMVGFNDEAYDNLLK
jgi:arsenate reductase-like glutaredoxin family protein